MGPPAAPVTAPRRRQDYARPMTVLLPLVSAAWADQCAWIDASTAASAVRHLPEGALWVAWCEPCGDPAPVAHVVGQTRTAPTSSPQLVEVSIDGSPIDLAYVFVRATPDATRLTNLAKLAACPASGVSATIPVPPPAPVAYDLPVPSPCSQRTDQEGDGRWDFVQHYVYGPGRFLEIVLTDSDGRPGPDAMVRFTPDASGRPATSAHDDDADGTIDRVTDCREAHCTTNWVPVCPPQSDCTVGPLGLVEVMRRGPQRTVNDYSCWEKVDGAWRYRAPADLPRIPGR